MIKYVSGDIFESDADCLFNPINCEGYMGKGIAYQFKQRFPKNNIKYIEQCKLGKLKPGILFPFVENGKTVINFPTKNKWRNPSELKYITDGLDTFVSMIPSLDIKKLAIPPLGCGNGGLNWEDVKALIEEKLGPTKLIIELFQPMANASKISRTEYMTVYDLLLLRVRKYLDKPSSLRFQKTLFFVNYYSKKNVFKFSRGRYGPYSKSLYHDAEKIGKYQKNNSLTDYEDTFEAIYQLICSKKVDEQYSKLSVEVDKALQLVNSINEDLVLEGMATALYLIQDEGIVNRTAVYEAFYEWSDDKAARFKENIIQICLDKLEGLCIIQRNLFDEYQVV